jgi:phage baseplate assembly protein W
MALDKFLGLQYPLTETPRGIMAQKSGVDQIKADLLQLLLTNPGERVMLPEFGTPLRELFFEPNDPSLAMETKRMVSSAIAKWEPRIEIKNITVGTPDLHPEDTGSESEAIVGIHIEFYDPEDINVIEALVLEVPIGS